MFRQVVRALAALLLTGQSVELHATGASVFGGAQRSPEPFSANVSAAVSGDVRVTESGTGHSTQLANVKFVGHLKVYKYPITFTNCASVWGPASFATEAGDLHIMRILTSCGGEAKNFYDADRGYFIITGGTRKYAGVLGSGTIDGADNNVSETDTYAGSLSFASGTRGQPPPLSGGPAGGSFLAHFTGNASAGRSVVKYAGNGTSSLTGALRLRQSESVDRESVRETGCRGFQDYDGVWMAGSRGSVLSIAVGLACGTGATRKVSGYFIVNGGTNHFIAVYGNGTMTGTEPPGKSGKFSLSWAGNVVLTRKRHPAPIAASDR